MAFIGNFPPRQCGIATFTADLCASVARAAPSIDCLVVAVNDPGKQHDYPETVRFEIEEGEVASYRRAAQFLTANAVDVVCLQHEYGIFGGKSGSHVLTLLRELRIPVVTTLHTLLGAPSPPQRSALDEIVALSERIVVMSTHAASIVIESHGAPPDSVDVIPHGIPIAAPGTRGKATLGFAGRPVILTFGLLSPDKGIEFVVDALPGILKRHPDTVFVVVGATHPHVKDRHGEAYRLSLMTRIRRLGVEDNVVFHDRFVSDRELAEFLSAADIYITPYLNPEQSTSGTLARAVAAGRAVISTPYWHARELLADDRGVLVPARDAAAITVAANDLLDDDAKRTALGTRAAEYGHAMAWPLVAERYVQCFHQALEARRKRTLRPIRALATPADLPELNLDHLRTLTDQTGLLQHAAFDVPRYHEGYCLDDNSRALLLMALLEDSGETNNKTIRALSTRYLAFVAYAFNERILRFRNFMSYSRRWTEESGSEDSHGHALWALGTLIGRSNDPGRQTLSGELFQKALPNVLCFSSPRAWAYGLLGINEYLRAFQGDSTVESVRKGLISQLFGLYRDTNRPGWSWFENYVTYSNARLSQALLVSGVATGDEQVIAAGLQSLEWLAKIQISENGWFAPVGSNGFYERGAKKAEFDQQPLEATGMVSACLDAFKITGSESWAEHARRAFDWFLGQNHLGQPVYDATTGGCRDGLHAEGANENQGAESTLSFLLALVEMRNTDGARLARAMEEKR